MANSTFVYVTYIRASQQDVWHALTDTEFSKKYWFGASLESEWKVGSPWRIEFPDQHVTDSGEILESDPPRRLVIKWINEWDPVAKAEGYTRCAFDLEPAGTAVKLTVTHSVDKSEARVIQLVSGGWPRILSNLKSLLETGELAMPNKM